MGPLSEGGHIRVSCCDDLHKRHAPRANAEDGSEGGRWSKDSDLPTVVPAECIV